MEKSKKVEHKSQKLIIIGTCILLIVVGICILLTIKKDKKEEVRSNLENVVEGTKLFEDIGHYEVAIAGNNNADRGTGINTNVKLINSYPENWDEIKKNIPEDILSRINNMSGSRLDFDGTIKRSWLTSIMTATVSGTIEGDVLIIKPDNSYEVLYGEASQTVPINITESGWYYVSFLDAPIKAQHAWSIMTLYEKYELPIRYTILKYAPVNISNGKYINVYYDNKYGLKNNFELFGVFIGGGTHGWAQSGKTEDKVEAILSDGTYKQLYQNTYNGKTIFEGRINTDFVNGTFNTIRSHNIKGGELDIFYEELGKDYFNGKDIVGYKITKVGDNNIVLQLIGLSQEIFSPKFTIEIENNINNILEEEIIHIKANITNSAEGEESIGYDTKIVCKLDEALSEIENIVVKIDGSIVNVESVYNSETNEIQVNGITKILPDQTITIEYDTKVNSNIQNKGEVNSSIEIPINVNVKSYPIDINKLEEEEQEKYRELYVEEESTVNVTGIYKKESGGVEVKYVDEVTNEEIEKKELKNGLQGDEYTTEKKEIEGYELVEIPENATGIMEEEKIIVTYKYRKLSKVIVKYIDINNNSEIEKEEVEYKEGDNYTVEEKEINGYRIVEIPENINGIIGREDIEVIYGYKKIAGGVEVKYIDEVTNEEIGTTEVIEGLEKDRYETEEKEIEGYELTLTPTNKVGEMTEEKITVIYRYRKLSKVVVKYVDLNNGNEIEKVDAEYKEGENYTTESKEINGYKLVEMPSNVNGIVGRKDIEVIYGYKKIAGGIIVKHIDEESGEKIKEEKISGLVGEKYSTNKLELEKYNYVEVVGNEEGELNEEVIEIIYYYEKKQAIVEVVYEDENGKEIYKEILEGRVGEKYKVEIKDIENYRVIEIPESIEGIYGVEEIVVKVKVERERSKVIINIVDEKGNIISIIEKEGYVGESEEINLPEIDGYYTDEKSIVIEYGKENNISITYKKMLFNIPNTSDIDIYMYIFIIVISVITSFAMYSKILAKNK